MAAKIRIMIVDDIAETRQNLQRLLQFESDIEVIGEAGNGEEAVKLAKQLNPDIVLMDINMPVMDGIQATEIMSIENPQIGIIILSVQGEQEYLRKAMAAGARDYLTKPPSSDELLQTVRRVYDLEKRRRLSFPVVEDSVKTSGKIIGVFSTKGGVGKSTIAVNLATSIAQVSGKKTVIVDLDLQFGDVALLLDLIPRRTIADLITEPDQQDFKTFETYLINHSTGLSVLPAPLRPEYAEAITARHIEAIIDVLQQHFDYIIIDTCQNFDEITLAALDRADTILVVTTLDVLTIKNVKLGLEVMASLHYESSKIKLLLNRSTAEMGVSLNDLEASLKFPIHVALPSDGKVVIMACNRGIPFVVSDPKAPISEAINALSRDLTGVTIDKKEKSTSAGWRSIIGR